MSQYEDKSERADSSGLNHNAYKEGCGFYHKKKFSRAKSCFETALEYWPSDPQAWFALGNCHDELKSPARAEGCFRKSLEYSGPSAKSDVYFNLGNSLFDQGKLEEAIICYLEVSGQSSAYQAAQKNLAQAKNGLNH
jgi:tetratricopeptide (TPR) repeat protein